MGSIWGIHQLVAHPGFPHADVQSVTAQILGFDTKSLIVEFAVCAQNGIVLPAETAPVRTDGLWRTTCFEAFLRAAASEAYIEMNFSPSSAWAAYAFNRYREGMRPLPLRLDPEVVIMESGDTYWLSAEFDVLPFVSTPTMLGLSAIIEQRDGSKSFWALAHSALEPPDFHHPDCFALELPPPAPA